MNKEKEVLTVSTTTIKTITDDAGNVTFETIS